VGTALSLVGSVGATALGFFIGRRSERLIERLVSPAEKAHADALLARWGALAIVVTRPIPLLAETTAILAGGSPLGWPRLLAAGAAGAFPSCLLYALTGAHSRSFGSGALMFAIVLAVAGAFYFLGRRRGP
jgi:membrane protein DedA with SNARE-associated domain